MHINPYLFFLMKEGQTIVWDYLHHKQFSLEPAYMERLKIWSSGKADLSSPLDQELEEAQLLSKEPFVPCEWGWDELSKIFHIGTKDIADHLMGLDKEEWINNYLDYCQSIASHPPTFYTEKEGEGIPLPPPNLALLKEKSFLEVMYRRKTNRSFKGDPISLECLSTILHVSLGPIHEKWADLEDNGLQILGRRKSFPSAGGLHPEEAYIVALRVEGLPAGVYHYNSFDHQLTLIDQKFSESELVQLLYGQYFAEGVAVGIFLTLRFEKGWWKYPHSRGYKMALLDIGHASQSVLLTTTAMGLDTWLTGAFSDSHVEKYLHLSSSTEQPIFFIGIGHGNNMTVDQHMLERVNQRFLEEPENK